jgi:hypothetical protein
MFKFLFKANKEDKLDTVVEADIETLDQMRDKADTDSIESYNASIRANIKKKLYLTYEVPDCSSMSVYDHSRRERLLVDAIVDEIVSKLDLEKK